MSASTRVTAARVQQRARLLQTEAEVRGIKRSELAVGEQVRGRERQPAARADDQVNVGRKIEGEVGQELGADRLRQRVHVVEHERRRPCGVGQIAEQRGDRFAGLDGAAKRLLDRRCRRRPSQRGERAEQEGLHEAAGVVALIEGEPCRAGAGRQPLAPHAREQRSLAVAGGRLDADERAFANGLELANQPLAAHHPAARARRCDLDGEERCPALLLRHGSPAGRAVHIR